MPGLSLLVNGIAWYREASYPALTELMADGASFPKSYASWRQKALRMERELRRKGATPVRIEIEPEAFRSWCQAAGLAPDSDARNRFVQEAVARQSHRQA